MKKIYRKLRRHLNSMPVGYPRTISGVEFRILEKMFTPLEAKIALSMDSQFRSVEEILSNLRGDSLSFSGLEEHLRGMASRGNILSKRERNSTLYALVPFVVGMYEFQNEKLDKEFYSDTVKFLRQGFAIDYLTTSVPQMRVVPVEKSLTSEVKINTYDEIKKIITNTDRGLSVTDCICKKAQSLDGEPCRATDDYEICIALRDYNDTYTGEGWGRPITKDEALEILKRNEERGLVIQTANEQDPQFICSCCSCCCGILKMMKSFPRPRDFAATNYFARVDEDTCIGCGLCVKRCNLEAITLKDKKAVITEERCIGCGLCVPACTKKSIQLIKTERETKPPRDTEELYETIRRNKRSKPIRLFKIIKALWGHRY